MIRLGQVDARIGACTFGINLIAVPPRTVCEPLITIQDAIESRIPEGVLFRSSSASLHLSIFQFVWARSGDTQADASAWITCRERVVSELGNIAGSTLPFALASPSIQAKQAAIIVRFSPSQALEALRDRASVVADEVGLNWNRPTIQHLSLFRYRQPAAVDELTKVCAEIPLPAITWQIRGLKLVRENVYPSLNVSEIQDYEFR